MAYPTLAQFRVHVGIATGEDDNLTRALNAAIAQVEHYCGRSFIETAEARTFPAELPYVSHQRRRLNTFMDFHTPTALTNGDGSTITAYRVEPLNADFAYAIILKPTAVGFWDGGNGGTISLTATWGMATPNDIFKAVLDGAAYEFEAGRGAAGPVQATSRATGLTVVSQDWPAHVVRVLDSWVRVTR